MNDTSLLYVLALTQLRLSVDQQRVLLREMGTAQAVYENRRELSHSLTDHAPRAAESLASMEQVLPRCEEELAYAEKHHIRVLSLEDEAAYPSRLRVCEDAPLVLFSLGNADLNAKHILSIVGTRHCTQQGRDFCRQFSQDLARLVPGTLVVSGLAYGIDIAAHRACLEAGLPTVGVLAHGLEQVYPRSHRSTAVEMVRQGGLLTEFVSNTRIEKMNFVQRNRIVAGLADATLVVESPSKGGSLITAEMANGYHREVFACPGRITDAASMGCNELIRRNAATLITSASDLVTDLGWRTAAETVNQPMQTELFADLTDDEKAVCHILQEAALDLTPIELCSRLGWSLPRLQPLLFSLEMKGHVKPLPGNRYHFC